jgi:hypothetical protein
MNIGFLGLLTIALIVLKLTEVIAWSWIWIFAPIWMPFVLMLIVLFSVAILYETLKRK